ncbi:hypothetical protein CVT26_014196 [Gymnopilus dilepis]|uniref:F-box domain-containing protein n=1 Tax=Gymnopilus dilepis TaxID=231916 RepID=A0A409VU39_9AGAR|nr:hypothetical protein CVT26_014196 [Gymnopilus dilepis]
MHPALIIDEILRLIFGFCLEEDRMSLACAARTCKTWTDPALDALWCQISSPEPLLLLLPSTNKGQNYIDRPPLEELLAFNHYAKRVKHLNNRQDSRGHPTLAPLVSPVPCSSLVARNLKTAQISVPKYKDSSLPFVLSPKLERLEIDLGFKAHTRDIHDSLYNFIQQAVRDCPELQHVGLRGSASDDLNDAITCMGHIPSLSLRLGSSLSANAFQSLLVFPDLEELEIHAGRMNVEDLDLTFGGTKPTIFPSLTKLRIRAKSFLIENILPLIQSDNLHHIHIELDDASPQSTNWAQIFEHICSKAKHSLRHLALEHHLEIPESTGPSFPNTTPTSQTTSPSSIAFDILQALHSLKELRHFSFDSTLPLAISDADVTKLVAWWPGVEHLELGIPPCTESSNVKAARLTSASLSSLAAKGTKLRKLVLPVILEDPLPCPDPQSPLHNSLRCLTIDQLNVSDPLKAAEYLHTLFPFLQNLEGASENTQCWSALRKALARKD